VQPTCSYWPLSDSSDKVKDEFKARRFRTLVIIGRLLEGFDHKFISVVAIARNVQARSRVLFTQFVGRAVRKINPKDPVSAVVISHTCYNQKGNYDNLDRLADEESVEDVEEEEQDAAAGGDI
jgi:superfamily II DNA or RNA helicase